MPDAREDGEELASVRGAAPQGDEQELGGADHERRRGEGQGEEEGQGDPFFAEEEISQVVHDAIQELSPDRLLVGFVLISEWAAPDGETQHHVTLDEREKRDWTPLLGMLRRTTLIYEHGLRREVDIEDE